MKGLFSRGVLARGLRTKHFTFYFIFMAQVHYSGQHALKSWLKKRTAAIMEDGALFTENIAALHKQRRNAGTW